MEYLNQLIPLLAAVQTQSQIPKMDPAQTGSDQFRAMLERQRTGQTAQQEQKQAEQTEQPPAREPASGEGEPTQEQMAAAAMVAAQLVAVVPVPDQPQAEEQAQTGPVLLAQAVDGQEQQAQQPQIQTAQADGQPQTEGEGLANTQGRTEGPQQVESRQSAQAPEQERQPVAETRARKTEGGQGKTEQPEIQGESRPLFRDVEAAPVKVSNVAQPQEAAEGEPVERQLLQPLEKAVEQNQPDVRVFLQPESLGSITVELTRTEDGALQILLHADNPRAQALLEKSASNLQGLLAESTQSTVQVQVERQQNSQGGAQHPYDQEGQSGQQGQNARQDQQSQRRQQEVDFLQQLRLGLIPVDAEAS